MTCYGGGIPTGSNTTDISAAWIDAGATVQSAPSIQHSSLTLSSSPPSPATISFNAKRLNTAGMKALYSFQISSPVALTSDARFYFDFHMNLSPYLDNAGTVECYIRSNSAMNDAAAQYTYCTFTTWWQLIVWNNLNSIAAGVNFYVDIFNIDLPKSADIGGNQRIMVTIDQDGDYSNGVAASAEVVDTAPSGTTPTDFHILTTSVSSNFILATQNLTITLDMLVTTVFSSATSIYVQFPAAYAQWISRS